VQRSGQASGTSSSVQKSIEAGADSRRVEALGGMWAQGSEIATVEAEGVSEPNDPWVRWSMGREEGGPALRQKRTWLEHRQLSSGLLCPHFLYRLCRRL
jgi:hypothetical protein